MYRLSSETVDDKGVGSGCVLLSMRVVDWDSRIGNLSLRARLSGGRTTIARQPLTLTIGAVDE
jgi:hypothetical protein